MEIKKQAGLTNQIGERGQALVEFALIIGVLLGIVFIIIEAGRVFQSWQTVQNAARVGARYALTGQFDTSCIDDNTCDQHSVRVVSIQNAARAAAEGLSIDDLATPTDPGYFFVAVTYRDKDGNLINEAAPPGEATNVAVFYNVQMLTPLFNSIARYIKLFTQVEVITEDFNQESPANPPDILPLSESQGVPPTPPQADLAISKSVSPSLNYAGEPFTFIIDIINQGPFDSPNVVIVDKLPQYAITPTIPSVTRAGIPIPGASCAVDAIEVNCSIPYLDGEGGIPSTARVAFAVAFNPPDFQLDNPPNTVELTNTATVFNPPAVEEVNPSDNEVDVPFTVKPWGDLEMVAKVGPVSSPYGSSLDYTLVVKNHGPSTAVDVKLEDRLPTEFDFVDWIGAGVDDCAPDLIQAFIVTCYLQPMTSGSVVTVTLRATPAVLHMPIDNPYVNNAEVFPEPGFEKNNTYENTKSVTTTITAPDLVVEKVLSPASNKPVIGNDFTYQIIVRNEGTDVAYGVVLTDVLPATVDILRIEGDCASPNVINGAVICSLSDLAPNNISVISIVVTPTSSLTVTNNVEVTTTTPEYFRPNQASYSLFVEPLDISLLKTASPTGDIALGKSITYRIEITGDPDGDATNLSLIDTLPSPITNTTWINKPSECNLNIVSDPHILTCNFPLLEEDDIRVVEIEVTPEIVGTFSNLVTLTGDYNVNESTPAVDTNVYASADLSVSKVAQGTVNPYTPITYTVSVFNDGPSQATNVTLTDMFTYTGSITGTITSISHTLPLSRGDCTINSGNKSGTIICSLSDLDANDGFDFEIVLTPTWSGSVTNKVSIGSNVHDPELDDNSPDPVVTDVS